MTDDELIEGFEATTLPAEQFTHEAHVRVAWWYLTHLPMLEAVATFAEGLQRFAAAKGAAGKYHETMTVAWMLLVADRIIAQADSVWTEFAAHNPDLFVKSPSPLARYYSVACLTSDRARQTFVLPGVSRSHPRP